MPPRASLVYLTSFSMSTSKAENGFSKQYFSEANYGATNFIASRNLLSYRLLVMKRCLDL